MKRVYLVFLLLVLVLAGCSSGDSHSIKLHQQQTVNVTTNYYDFDKPTLNIYHASGDDGIPYVNIEEFIEMMDPALIDLEKRKVLDLKYVNEVEGINDNGESYIFEQTIEINSVENTIYVNDINIFSILSEDRKNEYVSEIDKDLIDYTPGVVSKTYHLGDYGFDIIRQNRKFYMPLFLVNLFFTGDYLNVYDRNGAIYLVDDLSDPINLVDDTTPYLEEESIINHTANYLAFLLDNFYGFEDKKTENSYLTDMSDFGINDATSVIEQSNIISEYILSFDDLHLAIHDYGYFRDDITIATADDGSRKELFYSAFREEQCGIVTKEMELKDLGLYYIIKINKFTEQTKDLLAEAFEYIEDEDIVIDLSCNLGGTIGGIFDLLAYMTNETITVNYYHAGRDEKFTEKIKSISDKKIENTFYIYTSNVTFSAASQFVNIVKNHGLAVVFGAKTQGGANTVKYTVLPNNMILSYSTMMRFTDQAFESVEYGIEPDIVSTYDNIIANIYELQGVSDLTYNIAFTNTSTPDDVFVHVDTKSSSSPISRIIVEVFDINTGIQIDSFETTSYEFDYTTNITSYNNVEVIFSAEFVTNGPPHIKTIKSILIDDKADFVYEGQETSTTNTVYYTRKDYELDNDYIKVEIDHDTILNLNLNGDPSVFDLYDSNGDFIERNDYIFVTPGTYYINSEISAFEIGNYSFEVETVDEINPYGTVLDLGLGLTEADIFYDYENDEEIVYFTLHDKSFVTIGFDPQIDFKTVTIKKDDILVFHDVITYLTNPSYTIILDPGEYALETSSTFSTKISFTVVDYTGTDLSGNFDDDTGNFGTYEEGIIDLSFESDADQDIYTITVSEDTYIYYYFSQDYLPLIYDKDLNVLSYDSETKKLLLKEGINYIVFSSFDGENEVFQSVLHKEFSTFENKQVIAIDEEVLVSNYSTEATNYYAFTLDSDATITINNTHDLIFSNIVYSLYDSNDMLIDTFTEATYTNALLAGDYYLEVEFTSEFLFIGTLEINID